MQADDTSIGPEGPRTYSEMLIELSRGRTVPLSGSIVSALALVAAVGGENLVYALFFVIILGVCVYFTIYPKTPLVSGEFPPENLEKSKLLAAIFFILLTASTIIFYTRPLDYSRPMSFFLLASVMAMVIFLQTILAPSRKGAILLQVVMMGAVLIMPILSLSKTPLGIDPWHHQRFAELVAATGSLPEIYYHDRPIFQLSFSGLIILGNLDYMNATAVLSTALIIVATAFVFLIAQRIFEDTRVSLISSILLVLGVFLIRNGYWLIPSAFGFVMIIPIIHLIMRSLYSDGFTLKISTVIVFFTVVGVATHPYPILCLALIMLFYLVMTRMSELVSLSSHVLNLFLIAAVTSLSWWWFVSNDLPRIGHFIRSVLRSSGAPDSSMTNIYAYHFIDELLAAVGFLLPLLLATAGFLHVIKSSREAKRHLFAWTFLGLTAIVMVTMVLDISFLGARWMFFSMMFCMVPGAVLLVDFIRSSPGVARMALTCALVFVIAFTAINSTICNEDNHELYASVREGQFLTDAQIVAVLFVRDSLEGKLGSDLYYSSRAYFMEAQYVNIGINTKDSDLEGVMITSFPNSANSLVGKFVSKSHTIYSSGGLHGLFLSETPAELV